jgi:hypothetical protein
MVWLAEHFTRKSCLKTFRAQTIISLDYIPILHYVILWVTALVIHVISTILFLWQFLVFFLSGKSWTVDLQHFNLLKMSVIRRVFPLWIRYYQLLRSFRIWNKNTDLIEFTDIGRYEKLNKIIPINRILFE